MFARLAFLLFLFTTAVQVSAQICSGSLGDPIVNITFGAGPNPGPMLTAATTNYSYITTDCPNDGSYAVRNVTNSCFSATWHTVTDHTGDPNGYFMLVNASMQPSAFYIDTVRNLCGNTTYEFAAWIVNVLLPSSCGGNGIKPDLTFRVEKTDGTILQSFNSGAIPGSTTPQWRQYGFYFKTDATTSDVVIRIINNSTGGCGNDLGLDDITFRACGPQVASTFMGISGTAVNSCEGSNSTYTFVGTLSSGYNTPVVQWQESFNGGAWTDIPGANGYTYTKTFNASNSNGAYQYRLSASESGNLSSTKCRVASAPLQVTRLANPSALITVNTPVCAGDVIRMQTTAASGTWSGPAGVSGSCCTLQAPAHPNYAGTYYFNAENGGCSHLDSVLVVIHDKPVISVSAAHGICEGDTLHLTMSGADQFVWSPSAGVISNSIAASLFPADTTTYLLKGIAVGGCADSTSVQVNVNKVPKANAGNDLTVMQGNAVQLQGTIRGLDSKFYWTPGYAISDVGILRPYVTPLSDTSYVLHELSLSGCGASADTMHVHVLEKLIVPNAFSPDGNGINDTWVIGGIETYDGASVAVFTRFGQQVFFSRSFKSWDGSCNGKKLPPGTYYYLIDLHNGFPLVAGWLMMIY